jgi:hypothetical protein
MLNFRLHRSGCFSAATAAAALISVSCQRSHSRTEWWQGEQERIALNQQLALMRYRVEVADASGFDELKRLDSLREADTLRLQALRQQRLALNSEVVGLEEKWSDFQSLAIGEQRHRAMGKTFKTFQLMSGRKFQDVLVAAIDDAGVTIRHADGSARLRFKDLDSAQQEFFGLEEDLASAAEKREAQAASAYERDIESQMALIRQQEILVSDVARRAEMVAAERNRSQQLAAQRVAAARDRPLARPATRFGSRSWSDSSSYSNYRSYRPVYRYVYYSAPAYKSSFRAVASPQPGRRAGTGCLYPAGSPKCKSLVDTTFPSAR